MVADGFHLEFKKGKAKEEKYQNNRSDRLSNRWKRRIKLYARKIRYLGVWLYHSRRIHLIPYLNIIDSSFVRLSSRRRRILSRLPVTGFFFWHTIYMGTRVHTRASDSLNIAGIVNFRNVCSFEMACSRHRLESVNEFLIFQQLPSPKVKVNMKIYHKFSLPVWFTVTGRPSYGIG